MVNSPVVRYERDPGSLAMSAFVPKYERVAEAIRNLIRSGQLAPGTQLPPVHQLQLDYDVSYGTLRTALRDLYREGWLEGRQGDGIFVAENPPEQPTT